jgi:LuxR family transcriptional regulator, maltose regulon positive regulatory protein
LCDVTLISAPAGYGKTILLSQWLTLEAKNGSFAWVSLDEQDNDPAVEAHSRVVGPECAWGRVRECRSCGVECFVNELGEVPQKVTLVLDDYQFATDDGCLESMDFFVEHLPENVHLVLATRSDPPLHLGRLRARGELSEIRTQQLAFSEAEAAFLLNDTLHLKVAPDDLAVLLGELARSNLFVVALDEHGGWYRYHHLFSDLLLYEMKSSKADFLPTLHGRASVWFEEEGLLEDAIGHAIAAADYERAGELISRHWFRYAVMGQLASLERWLEALPDYLTNRDAPLVLVRAWVCHLWPARGERAFSGDGREHTLRTTTS